MKGTKTQKAETTGCGLERGATPVQLGTGVSEISVPTSLVTQMVKNLSAMTEIWVQSMGQEEPLEKGMATHSSILAWRIPWTKEPVGYSPWDCKELDKIEQLSTAQQDSRQERTLKNSYTTISCKVFELYYCKTS